MKIIIFILLSTLTSSAFAECITAESSAAEKAAMGAKVRRLTGGTASWTEVKKGTSIKETKNTIIVSANLSNPLNSNFSAGGASSKINAICSSGAAIVIKASKGNVTITASGGRLLVGVKIPLIGPKVYQLLPTARVRVQKAEGPIPNTPVYETVERSATVVI